MRRFALRRKTAMRMWKIGPKRRCWVVSNMVSIPKNGEMIPVLKMLVRMALPLTGY